MSVEADYVPATELLPKWRGIGYVDLCVVTLDVEEVIWGDISTGAQFAFSVQMSNSGLRFDYTVGQQVVVGLEYRARFRGGTYFGGPVEALFVLDRADWVRQGHVTGQRSFALDEIRAVVSPYRLEVVEESADIVVTGVVTKAQENMVRDPLSGGEGRVWTVSINVEEVLKGHDVPNPLTFEMFGGGFYWPPWAEVTPRRILEGKRYCALVKRTDSHLYSAGGVNGFFKTEGNRLIRNELPLSVTIDRVRALVGTAKNEH